MSLFITFEGIEGSGKTTQIQRLCATLQNRNLPTILTREPGGCAIADKIRAILLDAGNTAMIARTELLLYAAARAQHVEEIIRPALAAGKIVLCDRFTDATLAYQGYGRQLPFQLIHNLNDLAIDRLMPHLTLLFDLPVETGLGRALDRIAANSGPAEDRFEHESTAFHQRIRDGYLQLARENPGRFRIIDADQDLEHVWQQVLAVINEFLAKRATP